MKRRAFLAGAVAAAGVCAAAGARAQDSTAKRPNVLFAIADDWSWPHASIGGTVGLSTPHFDRIAREGVLFEHCFAAAPQCSPNRASILTGRHIWQNEEAGTHASLFPKKLPVFTNILEESGYVLGFTGKAWGPGDWERSGWPRNPVGPVYEGAVPESVPADGIHKKDYAANFARFLAERPKDQPFCFWYGAHEPHRRYEKGSGARLGKSIEGVEVPGFLPNHPEMQSDLLDYFVEIEWFDQHLGAMLAELEAIGELDNTIVIVTGDNGMPFPGAKANLHEHGINEPLAVRWPAGIEGGWVSTDLVGHADLAPTILEAAGIEPAPSMTGRSFLDVLRTKRAEAPADGQADKRRTFVVGGRERHTHARFDNLGYPARYIRAQEYLYIRNYEPDRWPAGDPQPDPESTSADRYGYKDIDGCPAKDFMIEHKDEYPAEFARCFAKRPADELYRITEDDACMKNLALDPANADTVAALRTTLEAALAATGDPRVVGPYDIFDSYPRVSETRPYLGGFAERGAYNPKYQER